MAAKGTEAEADRVKTVDVAGGASLVVVESVSADLSSLFDGVGDGEGDAVGTGDVDGEVDTKRAACETKICLWLGDGSCLWRTREGETKR